MKKCSKCGELKPYQKFSKNRSTSDGLQGWCKHCRSLKRSPNAIRNKLIKENMLLYGLQKCRVCEEIKTYNEFHRDSKRNRGYRSNCKDCIKDYQRDNAEAISRYGSQYRKNNIDYITAWHRNYYQTSEGKSYNKVRAYKRRALVKQRLAEEIPQYYYDWLMREQDHRCIFCFVLFNEESTTDCATLEHIIPFERGGFHMRSNIVWVCKSCNSSKRDKLIHEWIIP